MPGPPSYTIHSTPDDAAQHLELRRDGMDVQQDACSPTTFHSPSAMLHYAQTTQGLVPQMEHVNVLGVVAVLAVQVGNREIHPQKNDVCLHW